MADIRIKDLPLEAAAAGASDYVEIDKGAYVQSHKITVDNLTSIERNAREGQDNVIEASSGLQTDGTYGVATTSSSNTWYLRQADFTAGVDDRGGATGALTPSLKSADRILDATIYEIDQRLAAIESGAVLSATLTLSHADIRSLNSFPVDFPITPPSDMAIVVLSWEWKWDVWAAAYNTNTNLLLTTSTALEQGRCEDCLISTAKRAAKGGLITSDSFAGTGDEQLVANNNLSVTIETGDPRGGDASNSLIIYVSYKLIFFP